MLQFNMHYKKGRFFSIKSKSLTLNFLKFQSLAYCPGKKHTVAKDYNDDKCYALYSFWVYVNNDGHR